VENRSWTDQGTAAVFGCPFDVRRALLIGGWLLATTVVVGTCNRRRAEEEPKLPDPPDVRSSPLSSDEVNALGCALRLGRDHTRNAVPVSVAKEPRFPGEPPDWRSGGEWTVRFVEKGLTANSRDGSFRVTLRMPQCALLQMLIPG
jgi:hypothetical protein